MQSELRPAPSGPAHLLLKACPPQTGSFSQLQDAGSEPNRWARAQDLLGRLRSLSGDSRSFPALSLVTSLTGQMSPSSDQSERKAFHLPK